MEGGRERESVGCVVKEELSHPGCVGIKEPVQSAFLM